VQNAWTDVHGSVYSISSNQLLVTPSGSNSYKTNYLLRPSAEAVQDGRVQIYYTPSGSNAPTIYTCLRWQDNNDTFYAGVNAFETGAGSIQFVLYAFVGGVLNTLAPLVGTNSFTPIAGHQFIVEASAVGINPTTLQIIVTDVTSSTVVAKASYSYAVSNSLQGSGQFGMTAYNNNGSTPYSLDEFKTFYSGTAGLTISPTNLSLSGGTASIAVTGAGTAFSGSPFTLTNEGSATASLVSQSVSSGTAASLSVNPGTVPNAALIKDTNSGAFTVLQLLGSAITASPVQLIAGSGNQTVTLTGTATNWTAGTPGTPTFTIAGSGGASGYSIVSQVVNSTTSATLTINPGTTGGTLTITDPSTGSTTTVRSMFLIGVTDTNLYASPYSWFSDGSGSLQSNNVRASATYIKTTGVGSYIKLGWTGTDIQLVPAVNLAAGAIRYAIDDLPYQDLPSATSGVATSLATGLTQGTHTVYLLYNSDNGNGADRWTTPTDFVSVTGFYVNGASSAPTLNTKRGILFWDSYGEGKSLGGPTGTATVSDHSQSAVLGIMNNLGTEYGAVVYAGLGYSVTGLDNVPPVYTPSNDSQTSWNKFWAGQYRLYSSGVPSSGGLYSPAPDYILAFHGTNDKSSSDATVTAAVSGWLTAQRAACSTAKILVCICPNGSKASAVTTGFNNYQTATPDSKAFLINIGVQPGLAGNGSATTQSADGLHPRSNENVLLASLYTSAIQVAITPPTGSSSRGVSRQLKRSR